MGVRETANLNVLLFIVLDVLRIPNLLPSLASIKIVVFMQRQLDHELVVAEFQILNGVAASVVRAWKNWHTYSIARLLEIAPVDLSPAHPNSRPKPSQ